MKVTLRTIIILSKTDAKQKQKWSRKSQHIRQKLWITKKREYSSKCINIFDSFPYQLFATRRETNVTIFPNRILINTIPQTQLSSCKMYVNGTNSHDDFSLLFSIHSTHTHKLKLELLAAASAFSVDDDGRENEKWLCMDGDNRQGVTETQYESFRYWKGTLNVIGRRQKFSLLKMFTFLTMLMLLFEFVILRLAVFLIVGKFVRMPTFGGTF